MEPCRNKNYVIQFLRLALSYIAAVHPHPKASMSPVFRRMRFSQHTASWSERTASISTVQFRVLSRFLPGNTQLRWNLRPW